MDELEVLVQRALSRPLRSLGPWPLATADPRRRGVVEAEEAVRSALAAGAVPHALQTLRYEAYRLAAVGFGDRWSTARVALAEELAAEAARQRGDRRGAWEGWRSAWWIRKSLGSPGQADRDRVMGVLHAAMGRLDDARTRLTEALPGLEGPDLAESERLLHLVASDDR